MMSIVLPQGGVNIYFYYLTVFSPFKASWFLAVAIANMYYDLKKYTKKVKYILYRNHSLTTSWAQYLN